jgi:hypothetical protein
LLLNVLVQTKRPKVPLCYDFQNRITNVEKDIVFATKVELLFINTIVLATIPLSKSSHEIVSSAKAKPIDIDSSSTSQYENFLKLIEQLSIDYFKTFYNPTIGEMSIDETLAKMQI